MLHRLTPLLLPASLCRGLPVLLPVLLRVLLRPVLGWGLPASPMLLLLRCPCWHALMGWARWCLLCLRPCPASG